ncbi:hypothetical protein PsorP6_011471 [Peronosclerospora sorghi]|uniref:Uncharacterized protein n=1 Tax=Peronosclerospora sorghi TaxID=230839 RepID=A0ACC0WJB3_9STRA|nr:hypothetical protein PsorP6_011471 [Peronosclerospora sorghi]
MSQLHERVNVLFGLFYVFATSQRSNDAKFSTNGAKAGTIVCLKKERNPYSPAHDHMSRFPKVAVVSSSYHKTCGDYEINRFGLTSQTLLHDVLIVNCVVRINTTTCN